MPTPAVLHAIYGPTYLFSEGPDLDAEEQRDCGEINELLASHRPGTFIDYGCGRGATLKEAARLGWRPMGIEFSAASAERLTAETGLPVFPASASSQFAGGADVLHLGDVLEHLPDPRAELERNILPLLKRGGHLLVRGPLREYNFFGLILTAKHILAPPDGALPPPFHVLLPTPSAQRTFLKSLALEEVSFRVAETPWPAPPSLVAAATSLRAFSLYACRQISRALSMASRGRLGNRFVFVGRKTS